MMLLKDSWSDMAAKVRRGAVGGKGLRPKAGG
jgi:hypothetical protein